ncbi:DUF4186 domain-containing protein [Erwinia sp. 9145]|uniref:DUF4186 domain-containing protein n=1 Tax=Erwinia sp. 9145 TaxID=1500895 RepID=UPI00055148AF|nr:DUF4186 domain-containing protein [Erwinia sp. 9145]
MRASDDLFLRLSQSSFRQRFHLGRAEYDYCLEKGEALTGEHAAAFIRQRLAPGEPANDGKQTPMRGHPVFIAQHATATCCRRCLSKWHGIPQHQPLTHEQQAWVVAVIIRWLRQEMQRPAPKAKAPRSRANPDNPQPDLF